ncbi:ABC transporter ATP-binding protein [Herbiconiux sp. YIM B11900]|uniref:ABC transporter ATP-binding protein n=1 Tax=Herbiconiux sp. YIM B11900 TaxID=3404131 RepID=UPI003F83C605
MPPFPDAPDPSAAEAAAAPAGASLRASGWGWRHAGRAAWALRGLDLAIDPGERVLLLGASGAGKSTLLQGFAGVLGGADEGEEEGELAVDGMPPASIRGRAGLVLQDPDSQIVLARVGDDVAFGCENLGVPREEIWPRVDAALEAVGLRSAASGPASGSGSGSGAASGSESGPARAHGIERAHPTSELSGGQKQRVALAGVVAMRPGILLLDEPTANLDPAGVEEVRDAVAGVLSASGATFVVVEHRVDVWLGVVDRVVVLAPGGGVLADGAPDAVLGARGAELAADGVWVPGQDPLDGRPVRAPEQDALEGRRVRALEQDALEGRRVRALEQDALEGRLVRAPAHDPLAGRPVRAPAHDPLLGISARTHERPTHRRSTRPGEHADVPVEPARAPELLLSAHDLAVARVPGRPVATGIELEIRSGTATALTGPNGAGKTTLALTLAGLLPPENGEVRASDALRGEHGHPDSPTHDARTPDARTPDARTPDARTPDARTPDTRNTDAWTPDARPSRWARLRKRARPPGPDPLTWTSRQLLTRIGVVFQDPEHQFVTGTVRGELEVSLKALKLGQDEIAERVSEVSDRLRLGALLAANPYTLSGGEKRRLSVASALVARPRILILDEPTFGQDSRTWAELVRLLAEQMQRGTAVLAVTHDRAFIDALADHELVIGGDTTRAPAAPAAPAAPVAPVAPA